MLLAELRPGSSGPMSLAGDTRQSGNRKAFVALTDGLPWRCFSEAPWACANHTVPWVDRPSLPICVSPITRQPTRLVVGKRGGATFRTVASASVCYPYPFAVSKTKPQTA